MKYDKNLLSCENKTYLICFDPLIHVINTLAGIMVDQLRRQQLQQ
jgi:hypothetical protein